MRMSSGLEFDEVYTPFGDTAAMLCESGDFAAYAAAKPLAAAPGSRWSYSSGTANIISRIVRQASETETDNSYHFLRREFFDTIGMTSAVMEADPSGTFVGSSYTFATPRDWARFGLLFLRDGVWNGKRILPEGWVTYTTTPAAKAPKGEYGAMFWLNVRRRLRSSQPPLAFGSRGCVFSRRLPEAAGHHHPLAQTGAGAIRGDPHAPGLEHRSVHRRRDSRAAFPTGC